MLCHVSESDQRHLYADSTVFTGAFSITNRIRAFLVKALVFCAWMAISTAMVHAREVAGVNMPNTTSVAGENLQLNGMGVLKKIIFVKIYVVGLYLQTPTTDAQVAIRKNEIKRMVINMQHDVSRKKFVKALESSFTRNSGPRMPALRSRLDELEHALPAIKKGNVLEFTYLPSSGTIMRCQGREVTIQGRDFADALFSIWLGAKPVNSDLRRELLGQK